MKISEDYTNSIFDQLLRLPDAVELPSMEVIDKAIEKLTDYKKNKCSVTVTTDYGTEFDLTVDPDGLRLRHQRCGSITSFNPTEARKFYEILKNRYAEPKQAFPYESEFYDLYVVRKSMSCDLNGVCHDLEIGSMITPILSNEKALLFRKVNFNGGFEKSTISAEVYNALPGALERRCRPVGQFRPVRVV